MPKRKREEIIQELARKWQEGTITEEEKVMFNKWYHSFDDTLLEETSFESPEELRERLYRTVYEKEGIGKRRQIRFLRRVSAVAASVLLIVSFSFYLYFSHSQTEHGSLKESAHSANILPGGNRAVLTLADGSSIILDSAKNGVLVNQGNISIRKSKEGQLIYQVSSRVKKAVGESLLFNTITTPRGGQYQVDLPDGTRVWLNAASMLKFPAVFSSKERRVELQGEAYFEVASAAGKGKRLPFIVVSGQQQVSVLGTHFNINAYDDEEVMKTTLLEGAVRVSQTGIKKSEILRPGEQARVGKDIKVAPVDTEQEMAWKRGYFIFDNESVQSIMRKISRWYDVDVEYKGNIQHRKYAGTIQRSENISEVLRIMELTKSIHFRIEERRVIVMP